MQKYGLKKLIVEQATTIISSIRFYNIQVRSPLDVDNDVVLFAKILKNQIDEGFYYVQQHIRETIKSFIKEILRQR